MANIKSLLLKLKLSVVWYSSRQTQSFSRQLKSYIIFIYKATLYFEKSKNHVLEDDNPVQNLWVKACDQSLLISQETRFNAYLSNNLQSENTKSVYGVAEATVVS